MSGLICWTKKSGIFPIFQSIKWLFVDCLEIEVDLVFEFLMRKFSRDFPKNFTENWNGK
jgi:hypothetical protein